MPSEYMTEGKLTDFLDALSSLGRMKKNIDREISLQKARSAYNASSIYKMAKNLTMSFPVICSDTISPQTALLITKATERNVVSMLQMVIASFHINASSGSEAIKMIHTNLDNAFSAEDIIDAVVGTTMGVLTYESASALMDEGYPKRPPINYARILEQAKQDFMNTCNIKYPDSSFAESAVSDYIVTNRFNSGISVLKEAKSTILNDKDIVKEINKAMDDNIDNLDKKIEDNEKKTKDYIDYAMKNRSYQLDREKFAYTKSRDNLADQKDQLRSNRELFYKQILDSDVKKANELQPTLMVIPFYYKNYDDNGKEIPHEFVAGVKSRLIAVTSEEIIDNIANYNKTKIDHLSLIKATSGEISMAKDFIGAIQQAKIDAKRNTSKLSKTSPLWRTLQARSSVSGLKRLVRISNSKNAASAITTLVITIQEAEYIAENYGIDITNPAIARDFMEHFNLMSLVIVDEQTEMAKFFFDGEKYFTDYSFTALDKENNSSDTRKLISLLNKTR